MKLILYIAVLTLITFLVLVYCTTPSMFSDSHGKTPAENAKILTEKMNYVQDSRTGLCFAVLFSSLRGQSIITNVPCGAIKDYLDE